MSVNRQRLQRLVNAGLLVGLVAVSFGVSAQSEPVSSLRDRRQAAEARDQERLARFLEDQQALNAALEEARAAHQSAEEQREALQAQQTEQAEQASELTERQNEQGEALSGLLANLARHSTAVRSALGGK